MTSRSVYFIEIGQQRGNVGVLFDADYRAHARTIGFVCDIIDTGELFLFLLAHFRDLAHKLSFIHLIGKLGDDNIAFSAVAVLYADLGAQGNAPLARLVCLIELVGDDVPSRRKVRGGNILHHLVELDVGMIDVRHNAVNALGEVVRRDIGGKSDRNARRAVDEQIGESPGKHIGLF